MLNASQKSWGGDKNKEVGRTKFKFGRMIIRKIIKITATRCHILRLKCTKFDWAGAPPRPIAGGAPDPLAGFKGSYF